MRKGVDLSQETVFPNPCLNLCWQGEAYPLWILAWWLGVVFVKKRQDRVCVYCRTSLVLPSIFWKITLWAKPTRYYSYQTVRVGRVERQLNCSQKFQNSFSEEGLIIVAVYHSPYDWKDWIGWSLHFTGYFALCWIDEKIFVCVCFLICVLGYPRE